MYLFILWLLLRSVLSAVINRLAKTGRRIVAAMLLPVLFAACSSTEGFTPEGAPTLADPAYQRTPPPLVLAEYVGTNQVGPEVDGDRSALIDMTNISQGYIAAQCSAPTKAKMIVIKGENSMDNPERDQYGLSNDGSFDFYPITRGDGQYTFIVMIFVGDTPTGPAYQPFLTATANVQLENEFGPFLVQNRFVNYNADSACVAQSYEITQHCKTNMEVVQQIYAWVAANVAYDIEKGASLKGVTSDYEPNPDETLRTKKGICYDFASLTAAMLRANGIPTQLIKGDVADGNGGYVYHAWNMVWLDGEGWIAVELAVNPDDWTRIDTTFASAGADISEFIGDGANYTTLFVY